MTTSVDGPFALPVVAYLDAIRLHGDELAAAAEAAGLEAAVPTCPEWTVRDLVQHTESVYRHKTEAVRNPTLEGPPPWTPVPDDADIDTYRDSLVTMLDLFASTDLTVPTWTWCPHDHRADWWVRRMAHEAAIHGADAVIAAGRTPVIDDALATDGVDEILEEMLIGGPSWGSVTPTERRVALRTNEREWRLQFARFAGTSPNTGNTYDLDTLVHDDSEPTTVPDAVLTTDPATLDLWLWGRATLPPESVSGDASAVAKLREVAAEGTQ